MQQRGRPLIEFLGLEDEEDTQPVRTASLLVCAYRSISAETCESLLSTVASGKWRYIIRSGDAWIGRARSVVASQWYRQTTDDVFVMVDADIIFTPQDMDVLVRHCKRGQEIVCADYPTHNGQFLAGTTLQPAIWQDGLEELRYAPAGCMAVHRSVLDVMVRNLPLYHASLPIAYWPFFATFGEDWENETILLSEDFAFTIRARRLGFHAWRDTNLHVKHISEFAISDQNMAGMHQLAGERW